MSRWKRVMRGILGMGTTVAAIGGGFFAVLTAIAALLGRLETEDPFFGILAGTVWGFAIGATFATVLALAGRTLSFDRLSLSRVAGVGALGGLMLAATLVGLTALAGDTFTGVVEAFTFLPLLGAGAGAASLAIARRASPTLQAGDEEERLIDRDSDPGISA